MDTIDNFNLGLVYVRRNSAISSWQKLVVTAARKKIINLYFSVRFIARKFCGCSGRDAP
jgi:hypothetical protein